MAKSRYQFRCILHFNRFYLETVTSPEEGVKNEFMPYVIPGILGLLSVCIAFISIGMYKKRMRQIMLSTLNSLLIGTALGLSAYWSTQAEGELLAGIQGSYSYGLFFACHCFGI